jgi:hypothetical protein
MMHPGRLFLVLTGLVEACIALPGCMGCACQTPDRSSSNPLRAPPTFASAASWANVCEAACAPNAPHGPCTIDVSSNDGTASARATVKCVKPEGGGVLAVPTGDWASVCDERCGFTDWHDCSLDPAHDIAHCFRPGCTGGAGRRPHGFRASHVVTGPEVGAHFARMAELEAVSVIAFERLAGDLARLGAPPDLVTRAQAARRDEMRHAAQVGALARRFGGRASGPRVRARRRPCTMRELALENAREGCVAETFGVVVALVAAKTSSDAEVRRAMSAIAIDEAGHAELAWDVARWVEPQLDEEGRAEVGSEREKALRAITHASAAPSSGLPFVTLAAHLARPFADAVRRWVQHDLDQV